MKQGRPVATNLDLFLDNLLPPNNQAIAYRLPDHPRYEDLAILPPAYDPTYKGEDKNGLLILDELALWLNSRAWKEKGRAELINWLLLSRKMHWDLILLCQDHSIIDKQIKTTCCDYLVQAQRTDRRKIPYLGNILEFFFIKPNMPKYHVYDVYYGLSANDVRSDRWQFSGTDLYDGYDTNQIFSDGQELPGPKAKTITDMRAVYTYLPAAYLTKQIYIDRLQSQIDDIENIGATMAKAKSSKQDSLKTKAILLTVALVIFIGWRLFSGGFNLPSASSAVSSVTPVVNEKEKPKETTTPATTPVNLNPSQAFLDKLLTTYRPRLAAIVTGKTKHGETVATGLIEFYEGGNMVERFTIDELKSFGCAVAIKRYGVDIITSVNTYSVSAWPRPHVSPTENQAPQPTQPVSAPQPDEQPQPDLNIPS